MPVCDVALLEQEQRLMGSKNKQSWWLARIRGHVAWPHALQGIIGGRY